MHIPQGPTAALALELFDNALAAALRPSPDYDVSRWLYVPNHYSEYRYILGTRGRKPDLHGVNPSARRAGRSGPHPPVRPADRAFQRVRQLFDVQRLRPAGHPADDMERSCNPVLHAENRRAFPVSPLSVPGPRPVGRLGEHHREAGVSDGLYAGLCRRRQRRRGRVVHRRPLLKSGHPHHPLYLKGDTKLLAFDIDRYLRARAT